MPTPCSTFYVDPSVQLWKQRQNTEGLAHVEKMTDVGSEPRMISHFSRTICLRSESYFLSSFRRGTYQGKPA